VNTITEAIYSNAQSQISQSVSFQKKLPGGGMSRVCVCVDGWWVVGKLMITGSDHRFETTLYSAIAYIRLWRISFHFWPYVPVCNDE